MRFSFFLKLPSPTTPTCGPQPLIAGRRRHQPFDQASPAVRHHHFSDPFGFVILGVDTLFQTRLGLGLCGMGCGFIEPNFPGRVASSSSPSLAELAPWHVRRHKKKKKKKNSHTNTDNHNHDLTYMEAWPLSARTGTSLHSKLRWRFGWKEISKS